MRLVTCLLRPWVELCPHEIHAHLDMDVEIDFSRCKTGVLKVVPESGQPALGCLAGQDHSTAR